MPLSRKGSVPDGKCPRCGSGNGFTFVELVVVLAVLCFGLMLILPALATNKVSGSTIQCLNNFRQLANAWSMYALDTGHIIECHPWSASSSGGRLSGTANPYSWAPGYAGTVMISAGTYAPTSDYYPTNPVGLTKTVFYKYHNDVNLLHCPSDARTITNVPVIRSYAMNNWMHGSAVGSSQGLRLYTKPDQITRPSATWVLIDEDGVTIDDGNFIMFMDGRGFVNLPARRHDNGYVLNYADGRAEVQRLRDNRSLVQNSAPGGTGVPSVDYQFLTNYTVYP